MPFCYNISYTEKLRLSLDSVLILFVVISILYGSVDGKITSIGVLINNDSPIGTEQKASMEIAAQNFNNTSKDHKLLLNFFHLKTQFLDSLSYAEKMIEEEKIEVMIGMETWKEANLIGNLGNRSQIPVISLVGPTISPPLMQLRFPYLISISNDAFHQTSCISDLVSAYNWKKVIVIDEEHDGDFGLSTLLNEALLKKGSEIEYRLLLPPYSLLSDPKTFVENELSKLESTVQSRVFIVLRSSLPMLTHLFSEAKKLDLLENDSVWIISESVTSLLHSVEPSVISSMKGTIGIKTYFPTTSDSYKKFRTQFEKMSSKNSPGIDALRAHDSVRVITEALEKNKSLLENIKGVDFDGLSGKISFRNGKLETNPTLRIVNVVENGKINELDYWRKETGFSQSYKGESKRGSKVLVKEKRRGWAMPSVKRPLRIAIPVHFGTKFDKFVRIVDETAEKDMRYDGLCIQILKKVIPHLGYDLYYQFFEVNVSTYDEIIQAVYNKSYDVFVGDVTILAERLQYVDFTQPYTESGLSVVVPIKSHESAWMFLKPFTWGMWFWTAFIFIYTMFIVWFLEHPNNSEFKGSFKQQLGTTIWFTFSSLFFAQREKVQSNITRVVVIMWFFVVFVLAASYTANLSSMLTVKQLEADIDIESLKRNDQKVGYDNIFVKKYLEEVLNFKSENMVGIFPYDQYYLEGFKNKNITALFLEVPYEKIFLNKHCNHYSTTPRTYQFGGWGFAFQKGSPIAKDFSRAILKLSENGNITSLEKEWLTPSKKCSSTDATNKTESLSLKSFWGIYVISAVISTICFIIAILRLPSNNNNNQENAVDEIKEHTMIALAKSLYNREANRITLPTRAIMSPG